MIIERNILGTLIALTLFLCCNSNSKNKSDSNILTNELTKEESDYLIKRDEYIDRLQRIQKQKSTVDDSLNNAERQAMLELESKLKTILKTSHFSDRGKINLETLLGFLDFGLLDGLKFDKDSLHICYTSKNLFFRYFNLADNQFDRISQEVFESVFQSAYQFDARVSNFSFIKIHSTDNIKAYGMVAGLAQITGRFTPQNIYVLVSKGDYVYIAEKELKERVKEIPKCISVWDSIISKQSQTSVDTEHHVITYIEAYHADKKDSQCLPDVIKGLKENFAPEGIIVEQVIADTGYSSGQALKTLEEHNITGYIPNFGQYKHEREGFTYHKEGDYYACQQNKKIEFKKIKDNNGYHAKEYRSSRKDCGPCPFRSSCIGKSSEKKIVDTFDKPYYDKMHERLKTSYARKMKKLRQSTVEPVLGTLINFLAMKRVNTRGIKLANKCMMMAAIAYNLKKMMKFKSNRPMAAMLQLPKEARDYFTSLFFHFHFS